MKILPQVRTLFRFFHCKRQNVTLIKDLLTLDDRDGDDETTTDDRQRDEERKEEENILFH